MLASGVEISRDEFNDDRILVAFSNTVPAIVKGEESGHDVRFTEPSCSFNGAHFEYDTPILQSSRTSEGDTALWGLGTILTHLFHGNARLHD